MRSILLFICLLAAGLTLDAQNTFEGQIDPSEIRYYQGKPYDLMKQQLLRSESNWQSFLQNNGAWYVHFNELSRMPHRAYGTPLEVNGSTLQEKAMNFAQEQLSSFGIPTSSLVTFPKDVIGKYAYVNMKQFHEGIEVLNSRYVVKFFEGKMIMFGCDVFPSIDLNTAAIVSSVQAEAFAISGIANSIVSIDNTGEMFILPVPHENEFSFHLVYKMLIKTIDNSGMPAHYETLVDAHNGQVLSRKNLISSISHLAGHHHDGKPHTNSCTSQGALVVAANVTGDVYQNNPTEAVITESLENIYVTVTGTDYQADDNGDVLLSVNPGSSATVKLMGPWSRIYTNGTTPTQTVTLADGINNISMNAVSNIRERSAYRSVQHIHDFHKVWMPADFGGMDWQLPTNIDEAGTCNAFYDGSSINFYNIGGGCNATSLIADVCYHEYGHGINDKYYQSIGGSFNNGAMGEGYADYWALSCSDSPLLGIGFNTGDNEPLRRYDIDPKVYPADLSGEVHADGEIIMGAWYDTHLLMGSDWNITMPLFVETYAGMQAQASDGNEGEAYTDVLLDLLQADDTDGNINNGTPNGNAIIDGFYIHGITLISNAVINTTPILFADANEVMTLEVELDLQFPFTQYLQSIKCHYKINNGMWNMTDMTDLGSDNYSFDIDPQPAGTVVGYYFSAVDVNEAVSAVVPRSAHFTSYANLPFFTLIGVEEIGVHDSDDEAFFGSWQTGLLTDNASTGEWIEDSPLGSYTDPDGDMVQVDSQHTPNGEFCFLTGNGTSSTSGIGENDVDDGHTTLQTANINMTSYTDPIVSYWRYYTNSPPSGANPGADYWQVRISNNGGTSWTYVENNLTSDMSWRRNAFRVSDYVTPTAQVRMQFIASDSTHLGQNLDGGSLVEAALDDFILYDALVIGVDEIIQNNDHFSVYPNPASEHFNLIIQSEKPEKMSLQVINALGEVVKNETLGTVVNNQNIRIALPELAEGLYSVVLTGADFSSTEMLYIKK